MYQCFQTLHYSARKKFNLIIMKHNTQVALFYECWAQLASRENWYWEKTSQRKALPPRPTKAKSLFNLKERKRKRTKEGKKEKRKKKSNPNYPIELELWKTPSKLSLFPEGTVHPSKFQAWLFLGGNRQDDKNPSVSTARSAGRSARSGPSHRPRLHCVP